jgi:hypothetical protein
MDGHLSDLAALQWSRFGAPGLAPDSDTELRGHLEACAACRAKVEAFRDLDRSIHPYGEAFPEPSLPRTSRRVLAALLVLVALGLVLWIFL